LGAVILQVALLLDASLPLFHPNICGDVSDVVRGYTVDWRHITKLPVMSADAIGRCQLESSIGVMRRFIYLVQQRWPLIRPLQVGAVARRAVLGK